MMNTKPFQKIQCIHNLNGVMAPNLCATKKHYRRATTPYATHNSASRKFCATNKHRRNSFRDEHEWVAYGIFARRKESIRRANILGNFIV